MVKFTANLAYVRKKNTLNPKNYLAGDKVKLIRQTFNFRANNKSEGLKKHLFRKNG